MKHINKVLSILLSLIMVFSVYVIMSKMIK